MSNGIAFGVSGSFVPVDSATNWLADMASGDYDWAALTLSAVADAAGRQSIKVDLGVVRPREWELFGCVDYTLETPVTGSVIDYYWAPSNSGTQANANVAGNSGGDAACPDGAVPAGITLAEFLDMCVYIGSLTISNDAAVLNGPVGRFIPSTRWGQLIVVNNGGDAFEADDVEMHQLLLPVA